MPPQEKYAVQSDFNVGLAESMLVKGNNTIKGNALIRQRNGGVVTCVGNTVSLTPATGYAAERMAHLYGNTSKGFRRPRVVQGEWFDFFITTDPRYLDLGREGVCNAQGFFSFTDVADSTFFVNTIISWQVVVNQYRTDWAGGYLMHRVTVEGGEIKEIVLSY